MPRTATLRVRVDAVKKARAVKVFNRLGLPPSVAINLFLAAVAERKGLPFPVSLTPADDDVSTPPEVVAAVWESLDQDDWSYLREPGA
jgi:addiction module RelB/DinJ family antitoxin